MTGPINKVRIGLSSCLFPADPNRAIFKGKALAYMEQSMGEWLTRHGALVYMIPPHLDQANLTAYVNDIDGLVLQGGTDVAPENYGESPLDPAWAGDSTRDLIEIELTHACHRRGIPILGVCRGMQIMNVAFGGSMYQDIATQVDGSQVHRNWDIYDQNFHDVVIEESVALGKIYTGITRSRINSVHHQAVKELAAGFVVAATCPDDGIIEAIEHSTSNSMLLGVQWHPEFQDPDDRTLLNASPLAQAFLADAQRYKRTKMEEVL